MKAAEKAARITLNICRHHKINPKTLAALMRASALAAKAKWR